MTARADRIDWGEQGIQAVVSLAPARVLHGERPGFGVQDGERALSLVSRRTMDSEAAAEAWLAGDEAAELLAIIATLDLSAVPAPALP